MQAYSEDLRERVVAAYATGQYTISQVVSRFAVSISFVDKLLKRQRTSGSVAALPPRGGLEGLWPMWNGTLASRVHQILRISCTR